MSRIQLRAFGARLSALKVGKLFGVVTAVASLVAVSVLFTGANAQSASERAAAKQLPYIQACPQRTGPPESVGDLNVRRTACAKGQKPLKLARYPVAVPKGPQGPPGPQGPEGPKGAPGTAANAEFGVASVFVSRGGNRPSRFATYSIGLGSPAGTTTGGQFRFTCTPAQSPCQVSWGAAVISQRSGRASVFPRITIHKQANLNPLSLHFCEYVDGTNNNLGIARVRRVPTLRAAVAATRVPQGMGIGGSLDCGSSQTYSPSVRHLEVTSADSVNSNFFDVWVTLTFK